MAAITEGDLDDFVERLRDGEPPDALVGVTCQRGAAVGAEGLAVREEVTEHVMTLRLERVVVRLGQDVQQPCPPELQQPRVPELLQLLARVDPNPDVVLGSGAADWSDFPQRMHFICELFRAWQHDERLFAAP